MSKTSAREIHRHTAELFNRINSDAKFAGQFEKDPAAAMKELFPTHLANVPKKDINAILNSHADTAEKAYHAALTNSDVVARLPPGIARLLLATGTFILS